MAEQGSVAFNFERKGIFRVPASAVSDEDELMEAAIMAGADDVKTPEPVDEDDEEAVATYTILTIAEGMRDAKRTLTGVLEYETIVIALLLALLRLE